MGNTSSAHFERIDEDAWWSNSGRADPNPVDLEADAAAITRQRDDADFRLELERIREKRRSIIGKKRKEMEDMREEVVKLKAENEELKKRRSNEDSSSVGDPLGEIERLRGQNQELLEILKEKSQLLRDSESIIGKNRELKMSIAEMQEELQHLNAEVVSFEKEREDYRTHVVALKDVISVSKHMLQIRESQLEELKQKIEGIEKSLADREAQVLSEDLRKEYERQLGNIRNLRTLYEERQRMERREKADLVAKVDEVTKELEEQQKKTNELQERISELESDNSSKYDTIKTLESNLGLSKAECRQYQAELSVINQLFSEILLGFNSSQVVDLDKLQKHLEDHRDLLQNIVVNEISSEVSYALPKVLLDLLNQVNGETGGALGEAPEDDSLVRQTMNSAEEIVENLPKVWRVLIELLSHQSAPTNVLSTGEEKENPCYKTVDTPKGPSLVLSVSRTFIRLKDLILEKKALEKETNHLKQLNGHLENRLQDQEKRLELVHSELSKTWVVVGTLQKQHQKLHTQEKILRYELAQKRKLLNELKEELEDSREKWAQAREKNSNTEQQWQLLRSEFASRKNAVLSEEYNVSGESGYSDDREGLSSDEEPGYETDISEGAQKISGVVEEARRETHSQNIEGGAGSIESSESYCSEINVGNTILSEESEDSIRLQPTDEVSEITTNTSIDTVDNRPHSISFLEPDTSEEQSSTSSENSQNPHQNYSPLDTHEMTDNSNAETSGESTFNSEPESGNDENDECAQKITSAPRSENHKHSQETPSALGYEGDDCAQKITSAPKDGNLKHSQETPSVSREDEGDEIAQKITSAPKEENHKDSQETFKQCRFLERNEGDESAQKITSAQKMENQENSQETPSAKEDEGDECAQKITSAPKDGSHKDYQETFEQCKFLERDEDDEYTQEITSASKVKNRMHSQEKPSAQEDEGDECTQKIMSAQKGENQKHSQEKPTTQEDEGDECAQKITSAPKDGNHKNSQETFEQCKFLERDEEDECAQKITSAPKVEKYKYSQETSSAQKNEGDDECAQKIRSAQKEENHKDSQETSFAQKNEGDDECAQKIRSAQKEENHKDSQETFEQCRFLERDEDDECAQKITSAQKEENHKDSQETSSAQKNEGDDESAQKIRSAQKEENHKDSQETSFAQKNEGDDECAQKIRSAQKEENHKDSQETFEQCRFLERDEDDECAQKITSAQKEENHKDSQETSSAQKNEGDDESAQKIRSAQKEENHKDSQETSSAQKNEGDDECAQKIRSAQKEENHKGSQETFEQCRFLETDEGGESAQKISNDRHDEIENPESGSEKKNAETSEGPLEGPSSGRKLTLEEVLARRDERLRRLEGQASQLVNKVANTAIRSVAISNRLDNLHEVYGQGADGDGQNRVNVDGSCSPQSVPDEN